MGVSGEVGGPLLEEENCFVKGALTSFDLGDNILHILDKLFSQAAMEQMEDIATAFLSRTGDIRDTARYVSTEFPHSASRITMLLSILL